MLKIENTIETADDADLAASFFASLAGIMRDADPATPPKAARTRRNAATAPAKADPVETYNALAAVAGTKPVAAEPTPAPTPEPAPTPRPEPAPAPSPEPDSVDREALVARFRSVAQDRGILWMRPILQSAGVEKLSLLTNEQMTAALAQVDAEAMS